MKKYLLLLIGVLSCCFNDCVLAQVSGQYSPTLFFNFRKKTYSNATVYLNNGTYMLGEIRDFENPNTVEFVNPFASPLSSIETNFNFDKAKIIFRKNKETEDIRLNAEDVDFITFFDDEMNKDFEFKRLDIYTSNSKGIKDKPDRRIFVPLIKQDAISTYGFSYFSEDKYWLTFFYFANGDSNEAMSPYDFKVLEILKKDFLKQKMINSFMFASNNCDDFITWLQSSFDAVYDEDKIKKERKALDKEIKEEKKKIKGRLKKEFYEAQRYEEYYFNFYNIMIQEYKKRCK